MRSMENEEWKASVERQKFGVWKVQSVENEKKITFPIRHSPLSIRHSPFPISVTSTRNVENECV